MLGQLPETVARPGYDRARMIPALVHIGAGGFNRSHLAVYLDDLLAQDEEQRWGEFGIGLLPPDQAMHAALAEQDYLYGLLLVDAEQESYRIIGSLTGHGYAPDSREAVIERLSAPECRIVSLTVTEGGYFLDANQHFLAENEDIRHDLEHPAEPGTWLGYVAGAAERRMRSGGSPFTLLSCDNLQSNGLMARTALLAFADARSSALRKWLEANVSFPNSMVDRITPRTTEENRTRIAERFGVLDRCPVIAEPFRQWVLEDSFVAGRPGWERAGAQITTDVAGYEKIKMRLLNGGHSALGYLADLLGYRLIAEAASDVLLHQMLTEFMAEVRPTVRELPGIDLNEYTASIVRRFANPAIHDQVARICSGGAAKMSKFVVPSFRELLDAGASPRVLPLVIAGWLQYLGGADEQGRAIEIEDPLLDLLRPFLDSGRTDAGAALHVGSIFGDLAAAHPGSVAAVQGILEELRSQGVRATVRKILRLRRA